MSNKTYSIAFCLTALFLVVLYTYLGGVHFAKHAPLLGMMDVVFAGFWYALGKYRYENYRFEEAMKAVR